MTTKKQELVPLSGTSSDRLDAIAAGMGEKPDDVLATMISDAVSKITPEEKLELLSDCLALLDRQVIH